MPPPAALARPAGAVPGGGFVLFLACLPCLWFTFLPPFPEGEGYPPAPLPRRGRGRIKVISCKGLRPLHPRGLNPSGTYSPGKNRYPAGGGAPSGTGSTCRCGICRGACLLCRLLTLPSLSLTAPIPPAPFPGGEGGRGRQAAKKASRPPADTTVARSAGNQPGKPPKNHSSASSSRKAVTKPRAAASSDASAKIRRRGSVPENRQITKELSAK